MTVRVWDLGPDDTPAATSSQALFTLRIPELPPNPGPWDFDFCCTQNQATSGLRSPSPWAALPSTVSPTPIPPSLSARKPATGGTVLTTNHTNPRKTSSRTEGDVVKAPPGAIDENLCSL